METWKKDFRFIAVGSTPESSAENIGWAPLLRSVFNRDSGYICEIYESGNIDATNIQIIKDKMTEYKGRLIYKYLDIDYEKNIWIWDNSIVELENKPNWIKISALTDKEDWALELKKLVASNVKPPSKQGHVYAIVNQSGRLSLSSLGNAGIPLVQYNYNSKVLEDYNYIIKDLNSTSPSGRIVILEGAPGTGKTHLVRSMLLDVPDAMFVLVSPEMVSSLGGPELLPLLLTYKNSSQGPIILVLEDADKCLVVRDNSNINSIQSLLNLGDGILGSLLDLRIIATTNASHLEMEPAVLRVGRLSKRLEVGKLDVIGAITAFKNLLPGVALPIELNESIKIDINKEFSLAEIYSIARREGWSSEARKIDDDDDMEY